MGDRQIEVDKKREKETGSTNKSQFNSQMSTGELNAGGNTTMTQHLIQGGVEILLVASCYRNRDKLRRPDGHKARMQTLRFA